jgi:tetratricopeptide (TPR) repeat protein
MNEQGMAGSRADTRGISVRLAVVLLLALSLLPFANALRGGYVFDDHVLIERPLSSAGGTSPLRALVSPYWVMVPEARLWRPVASATLAADWLLGGGRPALFHLVNILLHAGVTVLLFFWLKRVADRPGVALAAASLFAVHPMHTEAVTWISGRAELLAAGFALAALLLSLARRPSLAWLTPLAVLFAVGSKESAATLPLILLYTRWGITARERRPAWGPLVASFGSVLLYLAFRRWVIGTWSGPLPEPMDNPMTGLGLFQRLPTVLAVAGRYVWLFLWPGRLSVDYSAPVLGIVRGGNLYLLLGVLVLAALLILAIRGRGRTVGWGAGFALLTFVLVSNLPVVIGTIMAERLLYLPSAGLILVAVAAIASSGPHSPAVTRRETRTGLAARAESRTGVRAIPLLLLGAVILAWGARTWIRNEDYRNDLALFTAALRTAPESPKVRANLALHLNKAGRHEEAIAQARQALRLNPTIRDARDILASSLELLGRPAEAIDFLLPETAQDPADRVSRRRLVELLQIAGRRTEADSILESGRQLDGGEVEWTVRAAQSAQEKGDLPRAIALWKDVLRRVPNASDAPLRLAFCQLQAGDALAAGETYAALLKLFPDSEDGANGLAWCLLETGGPVEDAVRLAESAVGRRAVAPYLDTLARAYLEAGRCDDARRVARKTVELAPSESAYQARLAEIDRRCR